MGGYNFPPIAELDALAQKLFETGCWRIFSGRGADKKDVTSQKLFLAKMLFGWEFGMTPVAALQGVYFQGTNPTLTVAAMQEVIARRSAYKLEVKTQEKELSEINIIDRRTNKVVRVAKFSKADAEQAGLWGKTDPWTKYTKSMLHARNVSVIAKAECADAFGGQPVYTPEEMGADVDENGDPVGLNEDDHLPSMRAGVNEELAAQGKSPMPAKGSPEEKAAKEAFKAQQKAAKDAKASASTTESSPTPTTTGQPTSTPSQPSTEESTASSTEHPGEDQLDQVLTAGLNNGWNQDQINEYLVGYLTECGLEITSKESLLEGWTWDQFTVLVQHVSSQKPEG